MPDPAPNPTTGVLFVCLGNICRSPLAEGVFIHLARRRSVLDRFRVDSCGTGGWHKGECADPRSLAVAAKHGVELPSIARPFDPARDPAEFDWIIAMDKENRRNLIKAGAPEAKVRLMMSYHPHPPTDEVPDPYYGGPDGFDQVYDMVRVACEHLLDDLT